MMVRDSRYLVMAAWILVGLSEAALAEDPLTVVITQPGENVTVDESVRPLKEFDILPNGTEIHVPRNKNLGLICSSEHWVTVKGAQTWKVNAKNCSAGISVEPGTYRSLAPDRGRYRTVNGILVLQEDTRSIPEEYLLLYPRQTNIREARPEIVWHSIGDVFEYQVNISGLAQPLSIRSSQAQCEEDASWFGLVVCRMEWPMDRDDLEPGEAVLINIGYRRKLTDPVTFEDPTGDGLEMKRLPINAEQMLERRLAEVASMPLSENAKALLKASAFSRDRLYADAVKAYREADGHGAATVEITFGDLYLTMGLYEFAASFYGRNLDTDSVAVQAAAQFGMGRVFADNNAYEKAFGHFEDALNLYQQANLPEAQEVQKWLENARERKGQP